MQTPPTRWKWISRFVSPLTTRPPAKLKYACIIAGLSDCTDRQQGSLHIGHLKGDRQRRRSFATRPNLASPRLGTRPPSAA
eukprot:10189079-Alexandrium_andersonii.AAC.1